MRVEGGGVRICFHSMLNNDDDEGEAEVMRTGIEEEDDDPVGHIRTF